jgi:type I restriction enzyme S subunit
MDVKKRIDAALGRRFPNNNIAPEHFGGLLWEYAESGLAPPHFVREIETNDEGKLWSNIWEAMLYRHLRSFGYMPRNSVKASGQHGPDFCIDHEGRTIWIEAIVPAPEGIDAEWLEPPKKGVIKVKTMPPEQMLLRCTAAVDTKRRKFDEYRAEGIVGEHDCTVIAVNICRLSDYDIDGNGISRFPLAMEAVFPIGPLAVSIARDGKQDGPAQNMPRFSIKNAKGRDVRTDSFLDQNFERVSAVIQGYQKHMHETTLVLSTVHNPLATNPLPRGLFGVYKEFVAEADGAGYTVSDVALRF